MKSNWIQIQIWVKDIKKPDCDALESYLRNMVYHLQKHIDRKFYLYEPSPHLFLAMEMKKQISHKTLEDAVNSDKPNNIKRLKIVYNTPDYENQETFLNIMNEATDFYLHYLPRSRLKGEIRKRKEYLKHIIHCVCNMYFTNRDLELLFYKDLYESYGGSSIDKLPDNTKKK